MLSNKLLCYYLAQYKAKTLYINKLAIRNSG